MVTNGRMFFDVIGLYFKALFRDEKSTYACIIDKLLWVAVFELAEFEIPFIWLEFPFNWVRS